MLLRWFRVKAPALSYDQPVAASTRPKPQQELPQSQERLPEATQQHMQQHVPQQQYQQPQPASAQQLSSGGAALAMEIDDDFVRRLSVNQLILIRDLLAQHGIPLVRIPPFVQHEERCIGDKM